VRSPAAGEIRDLVRSRQMIEVVLNMDGTAEGDVVGANERRRDHRELLPDDFKDKRVLGNKRAEEIKRRPPLASG
jgi:hypothetical protein